MASVPRRNSLRLQVPPATPPIPPSLRQSPYLNSPLFNRDLSSSNGPTDAADCWLQDTVPQAAHPPGDRRGSIVHRPHAAPPSPTAPHHPTPHSGPITPVTDAAPAASSLPIMSRHAPHDTRFLAHSLAPPPIDGQPSPRTARPPCPQHARSAPTIPRHVSQQGYFPHSPHVR